MTPAPEEIAAFVADTKARHDQYGPILLAQSLLGAIDIIEHLQRRERSLSEALKPFAEFADLLSEAVEDDIAIGIYADCAMRFGPNGGSCVGSLRIARAAIKGDR